MFSLKNNKVLLFLTNEMYLFYFVEKMMLYLQNISVILHYNFFFFVPLMKYEACKFIVS